MLDWKCDIYTKRYIGNGNAYKAIKEHIIEQKYGRFVNKDFDIITTHQNITKEQQEELELLKVSSK